MPIPIHVDQAGERRGHLVAEKEETGSRPCRTAEGVEVRRLPVFLPPPVAADLHVWAGGIRNDKLKIESNLL